LRGRGPTEEQTSSFEEETNISRSRGAGPLFGQLAPFPPQPAFLNEMNPRLKKKINEENSPFVVNEKTTCFS
jgi:hypothetical protein